MSKKKRRSMSTDEPSGGPTAFGALLSAKGFSSSEPVAPEPAPEPASPDAPLDWSDLQRLNVRRSTKGRKGKTVTLVDGFGVSAKALKPLARKLGKTLGCGVSVEEDHLVVQGDHTDRLVDWLTAQGVARVVRAGG